MRPLRCGRATGAVRTAVEDDAAICADVLGETGSLTTRFRGRGLPSLVAEPTFDRRPDSLSPSFRLQDPRCELERWLMAHMPLVAAGELRDPLALRVQMEADDRALHAPSVRRAARVTAG